MKDVQSWTKVLRTVMQYSYFSVISGFPHKTVHPFRNFLAVLPPPTLYKVETRKKNLYTRATESESEESERFHFFRPRLRLCRLWASEDQIVGVGSRSGRINQSQYIFPRFVIGFVLLHLLLLPTPTIWFSLDHKRNLSGIGTLFSLNHKLYASD